MMDLPHNNLHININLYLKKKAIDMEFAYRRLDYYQMETLGNLVPTQCHHTLCTYRPTWA